MFGKQLAITCLALCAAPLAMAATIDFAEAAQHVGEEMTVTGKVSRVATIPSGMTFINLGGRDQAGSFTAVARPGTGDAESLKAFEGQVVEITGTIELYKDAPQIVLKSAGAIRVAGGAAPAEGADMEPAKSGPEIQTFSVELEKREASTAGESTGGVVPTEAKVAIALPRDFKPSADQRVLAVFPDFFSDADQEKLLAPYIQLARTQGWVVLTARGPILDLDLPLAWHTVMFQAAIRHLSEEYPGIGEWSFYLAGNADGASRASVSTGAMMKKDIEVKGMYLSSLKREGLTRSIETFGPSKLKLKKLKVFVSHGSDDSMASEADSMEQTEAIREAGIKDVRFEKHDGRGGVDAASLKKALDWFEEAE